MLYKVYILYSPSHKKLFAGMTTSLTDKMLWHNSEEPVDWTSEYRPWTLIHMELFNDETEAYLRESYFESESGQNYIKTDILPLYKF